MTQAELFVEFMTEVWDGKLEPTSDGVFIRPSALYTEWHDARVAARKKGAIERGRMSSKLGTFMYYRFGDGSTIRVNENGGMLNLTNPKTGYPASLLRQSHN